MLRSSKAIPLVLIGTVTAMAGLEAVTSNNQDWNDDQFGATTQPYGHGSSYFHHSSFWHSSSGYSSHSGTSRGGFGSSGHAAGS